MNSLIFNSIIHYGYIRYLTIHPDVEGGPRLTNCQITSLQNTRRSMEFLQQSIGNALISNKTLLLKSLSRRTSSAKPDAMRL